MTSNQLARLEHLESVEWRTPREDAEYAHLLRLDSDMRAAYELLVSSNMRPTWVGGEYITVGQHVVRDLLGARRLMRC